MLRISFRVLFGDRILCLGFSRVLFFIFILGDTRTTPGPSQTPSSLIVCHAAKGPSLPFQRQASIRVVPSVFGNVSPLARDQSDRVLLWFRFNCCPFLFEFLRFRLVAKSGHPKYNTLFRCVVATPFYSFFCPLFPRP